MDLSDPQGVVKLGDWLDNPLVVRGICPSD